MIRQMSRRTILTAGRVLRWLVAAVVAVPVFGLDVCWSAATHAAAPLVKSTSGKEFGTVTYSETYVGSFTAEIELSGLKPQATYALTLNGKPGQPGNEELMRIGKAQSTGVVKEGFLDCQTIRAGPDGRYRGRTNTVALPPGRYDLKFFVKDVQDVWRVVLGLDILQFAVQPPPVKGQSTIRTTRIVPNGHIEGSVDGLPGDYKRYKVLVYVRTDKW